MSQPLFFNPPHHAAAPGTCSCQFSFPVHGGLRDGTIITVCGRVLPNATRFSVDLRHGSDFILHVNPRYDSGGYVVHNTCKNGWGPEERKYETPFPRGQTFALQILVREDSYKISTNEKLFSEYKHRIPFSQVDCIEVAGMAEVHLFAIQHRALCPAAAPGICDVQFKTIIHGGLWDGTIITVCGRVLSNAIRFSVDLRHGSDFILHVNPRYDSGGYVVHNTCKNGWGPEERKYETPFPRGQIFALQILVREDSYKISTNGKLFSEYKHRIPFSQVDCIEVAGMVEVHLFAIQHLALHLVAAPGPFIIPHKSIIHDGVKPGKVIIIQGVTSPQANRFCFSLHHKTGIAFDFSLCLDETVVVSKTCQGGKRGEKDRSGLMLLERGKPFLVTISCTQHHYYVFVNGKQAHTYEHRFTELEDINVLKICGDVELTFVQP